LPDIGLTKSKAASITLITGIRHECASR